MFKEITATKKNRKLVYGVGVNDAWYKTQVTIDGENFVCKIYTKWKSMLARCYSKSYHANFPTYIDCSVCNEWLVFSKFKVWMEKQEWQGKHLDKDILHQGNKLYSPDNCMFVTGEINALFTDAKAKRGDYPVGVWWHKRDRVFNSAINVNGKRVHIGSFPSAVSASDAYKKAKYRLIKQISLEQKEPLKSALLRYKIQP